MPLLRKKKSSSTYQKEAAGKRCGGAISIDRDDVESFIEALGVLSILFATLIGSTILTLDYDLVREDMFKNMVKANQEFCSYAEFVLQEQNFNFTVPTMLNKFETIDLCGGGPGNTLAVKAFPMEYMDFWFAKNDKTYLTETSSNMIFSNQVNKVYFFGGGSLAFSLLAFTISLVTFGIYKILPMNDGEIGIEEDTDSTDAMVDVFLSAFLPLIVFGWVSVLLSMVCYCFLCEGYSSIVQPGTDLRLFSWIMLGVVAPIIALIFYSYARMSAVINQIKRKIREVSPITEITDQ